MTNEQWLDAFSARPDPDGVAKRTLHHMHENGPYMPKRWETDSDDSESDYGLTKEELLEVESSGEEFEDWEETTGENAIAEGASEKENVSELVT